MGPAFYYMIQCINIQAYKYQTTYFLGQHIFYKEQQYNRFQYKSYNILSNNINSNMQAIPKQRINKILYVVGNSDAQSDNMSKIINAAAHAKRNFKLYIGDQYYEDDNDQISIIPIEQQKRNTGHQKTSFVLKKAVSIKKQEILVKFPLICIISNNKMSIPQDQMRKMLMEFRSLYQIDENDKSDFSDMSFDRSQKAGESNRGRGRPKGSKNKKKDQNMDSSSGEEYDNSELRRDEKKPSKGRPRGSKNKKKDIYDDQIFNELNFHNLLKKIFQNRSFQEVGKKLNRQKLKFREEHPQQVYQQAHQKRTRGRPKGRKNKAKIDQQIDSQANISQALPQRINRQQFKDAICCSKCSQRDYKKMFLQGKLKDKSVLKNIAQNIGVEDTTNLIIDSIKNARLNDIRELLAQVSIIQNDFLVPWDCNNRLQQTSYTIRTRKDYVRKQKQMINAMLQDRYVFRGQWWQIIGIDRIIQNIPQYQSGIQIYKLLVELQPQLKEVFYQNIPSFVRSGNYPLSHMLLQELLQQNQLNNSIYGYSKEHLECLNKDRSQIHFKKVAMLKQNCTTNFCSPIQCAVINPNHELLNYIIKHISQFNVGDSLGRKPIHYAAVLDTTKPLQILLKNGADLKQIDKKKMTPLIIAAKHGKYKIMKLILQKVRQKEYINFKDDNQLCALHYATIYKHQECVSLLLQDSLINKYEETKQKFTILHLAAGGGDKQLVKTIMNNGVKSTFDHFRRSPHIIALRNHHNDIFFYFLKDGPPNFKKDYSNNTLLHYAAAYGNIQLVLYLRNIIDQIPNKKNFYPWEIAVLKGHYYCAQLLQMNQEKIVNFPQHHHLIFLLLRNPRGTDQFINMIKYLIKTNIYQLNYQYNQIGDTCLHQLCQIGQKQYYEYRKKESTVIKLNQYEQMQRTIINMLLQNGADENIQNQKGQKPVNLCIDNQNIVGIQLLLRQIPFELPNPTKNNHFVYYMTKIACRGTQQMKFVYNKLLQQDQRVLKVQLRKTDCQGFQFLVFLMKNFTQNVHSNFKKSYITFIQQKQFDERQQPQVKKEAIMKAFHEYVQHQKYLLKLVNFLVEKGADPRSIVIEPKVQSENQNYKKWGIQHFLMRFPSLILLKAFMKWIDKSFNMQNSEGRTPLHLFCMLNQQGSLFNTNHLDMSPVPLIDFKLSDDYDGQSCLNYLLQNGLNSNIWDINRSTPLLYAALNGQLRFMKLLRMYGSAINSCNLLNQVSLIQIIKTKNRFKLQQIIEQIQSIFGQSGAVDVKDLDDRNALHHLVSDATNFDTSPQLCTKLLEYKLNINSIDKYGRSPIFYCFIKIKQNEPRQNRNEDRNNDKVQILQTLLNCKQIDLNIKDIYEKTPLHYACQKNFFFSILYLLDTNINYDVRDREGNTPLAICLKYRNLNQAALLIRKGVKYGHVIQNGHKYSYFFYAASKLSAGICFMLLDHGYPLQNALEECKNSAFQKILRKKYLVYKSNKS